MYAVRPKTAPMYTIGVSQQQEVDWLKQFMNAVKTGKEKGYLYKDEDYYISNKITKQYRYHFEWALDDLKEFEKELLEGKSNKGILLGLKEINTEIKVVQGNIALLTKERDELAKNKQAKGNDLANQQAALRNLNKKSYIERVALQAQPTNPLSAFLKRLMPSQYIQKVKDKYQHEGTVQIAAVKLNKQCTAINSALEKKQAQLNDQEVYLNDLQAQKKETVVKLKEVNRLCNLIYDVYAKISRLHSKVEKARLAAECRQEEGDIKAIDEIPIATEVLPAEEQGEYAAFAPTFGFG